MLSADVGLLMYFLQRGLQLFTLKLEAMRSDDDWLCVPHGLGVSAFVYES